MLRPDTNKLNLNNPQRFYDPLEFYEESTAYLCQRTSAQSRFTRWVPLAEVVDIMVYLLTKFNKNENGSDLGELSDAINRETHGKGVQLLPIRRNCDADSSPRLLMQPIGALGHHLGLRLRLKIAESLARTLP